MSWMKLEEFVLFKKKSEAPASTAGFNDNFWAKGNFEL